MRVWEFEDNKAIPSDLVREQDFILRVRRMQRTGTPTLVLNFALNQIEHLSKSRTALESIHKKLQEFAKVTHGIYSEMSNGDIFIEWEESGDTEIISSRVVDAVFPGHDPAQTQFLLTYHMPQDYNALRERSNHYIEVVRAAGITSVTEGETRVENAHGQLTAKNLDQIEQLLNEIDLQPYGRTQKIYRADAKAWGTVGEEYFIGFEDLRRERFPKLEVVTSEHFFFALCGMIDQRLLLMLTQQPDIIAGRLINMNLSVGSIIDPVFTNFVHSIKPEHRALIGFELHRGDLFQDFSLTLSAIDVLKREGFRVILDSITPDMCPYIDLGRFAVDTIKINVSKDRVLQLADPAVQAALKKLPSEKLIFFRCDNERALTAGRELGITVFQGWLIDDLAEKKG